MEDINKNYSTDTLEQLLRHLSTNLRVNPVSNEFSALKTNAQRVDFVFNLLDQYDLFPALVPDFKNDDEATKTRQKGNEMFKARKNERAIEFYTHSVALAENTSDQLAVAYANRSAVLFEEGFYEHCLKDIDRALEHGYPENLKPKLLMRQEKANRLQPQQKHTKYFETIPKIPETRKNKSIQCAADSIELSHSVDQGRHVVATRDISAGEVIAIEEPFSRILIEQYYNHCHDCLKVCYNLIPCETCTQVMYCCEGCRVNANYYHKYECRILATVRKLGIDKLKLLPLKIALQVKDQYSAIKDMEETGEELYYRSDRYKEIHYLTPNTSDRSLSDLFDRSTTSAIIFYLIKTFTDFFQNEEEEQIFKELVLLHMQTSACNFHEISELSLNEEGLYEPYEIGAGAYSFLSMFNHRCSPNVLRNCYGSVIVVRAIESINKGEQCYDNYGYHHALMVKRDRQAKLKKQYFFDCTCEVCETDWPLYIDLPEIKTNINMGKALLKLENGETESANIVLKEMLPKLKELEKEKPNRDLAEMQEIIKQCFALLGNVRRAL